MFCAVFLSREEQWEMYNNATDNLKGQERMRENQARDKNKIKVKLSL
jgi:hypothetical protein